MEKDQGFLKFYIILVIVMAAIGTLVTLGGGISLGSSKAIAIIILFLVYNITGCICWVTSKRPEYNVLGIIGAVASGLGFVVAFMLIIMGSSSMSGAEGLFKMAFGIFIISIAFAHICLMYYFHVQNKYAHTARTVAVIFISIFSMLFMIKIFSSFEAIMYSPMPEITYARILGAALILDLAATSLVPLCNRLSEPPVFEDIYNAPPVIESQPPEHTV